MIVPELQAKYKHTAGSTRPEQSPYIHETVAGFSCKILEKHKNIYQCETLEQTTTGSNTGELYSTLTQD